MSWIRKVFRLKESAAAAVPEETQKTQKADSDFEGRTRIGRVSDYLYGFNPQAAATRLRESSISFSNVDQGTEFDDKFFKPLGQAGGIDLPLQTQHSVQRLSNLEYRKNVRAYRTVELIDQFAFGGGVRFRAEEDVVQDVLEEFWEANDWENMLNKRMKSLSVFGEQLYPVFVNEVTALVTISSISPLCIRRIIRNPENDESLIAAIATLNGKSAQAADQLGDELSPDDKRYALIIRRHEDGMLGADPILEEKDIETEREAFFFAVNHLAGATRGQPDITPSIDWLEGLDGFLWSLLERASVAEEVVHDLTFEGADDKECMRLTRTFRDALRGGGIYGHNEKVTHKITAPNIGASEAKGVTEVILKQIQSGTGLAGLFFGDASDLTRSAASELTAPVAKMIQSRQDFFKRSLKMMFRYAIQKKKEKGLLDKNISEKFVIDMPRVFLRDLNTIATALVSLTTALTNAVDSGWITDDEAAKVYKAAQEELGDYIDHSRGHSSSVHESVDPEILKLYEISKKGPEVLESYLEDLLEKKSGYRKRTTKAS